MSAQQRTMVREYRSTQAFHQDAERLARDGWTVAQTMERNPRAGCMRGCLLGLFALVWRPKPVIVVTYTRAA